MGRKKREYTYEEWKKAMDLHHKYKLGYRRISRILSINENTVNNWLYRGEMPPAAKWVAEPSNELGYTTGAVQGDASVCKYEPNYEYIIQLDTIDPEYAETFSRAMSRLLGVNYHKPRWNKKRKIWRVKYQSKAFYTWYKRCEKQGLQGFKPYIEYNKETVKYYLRGLYDSDGNNDGNKQIYLSNSNEGLLKYVQLLLKKYFDIIATGPYLQKKAGTKTIINGVKTTLNQDYYTIIINRKEHTQEFLEKIGFTIIRKQLGLKKGERVFVKGRYIEPYELIKLGLFKLPFSDAQ